MKNPHPSGHALTVRILAKTLLPQKGCFGELTKLKLLVLKLLVMCPGEVSGPEELRGLPRSRPE